MFFFFLESVHKHLQTITARKKKASAPPLITIIIYAKSKENIFWSREKLSTHFAYDL